MRIAASANEIPLVTREQAANAVRDALRLYVGHGRRWSTKDFCEGAGIKRRIVESAMCDPDRQRCDHRPLPADALLSAMKFLGAEFTSRVLALAGQTALDLPDDDPDAGELAKEASEEAAGVVRLAINGIKGSDGEARALGASMIRTGEEMIALAERRA